MTLTMRKKFKDGLFCEFRISPYRWSLLWCCDAQSRVVHVWICFTKRVHLIYRPIAMSIYFMIWWYFSNPWSRMLRQLRGRFTERFKLELPNEDQRLWIQFTSSWPQRWRGAFKTQSQIPNVSCHAATTDPMLQRVFWLRKCLSNLFQLLATLALQRDCLALWSVRLRI